MPAPWVPGTRVTLSVLPAQVPAGPPSRPIRTAGLSPEKVHGTGLQTPACCRFCRRTAAARRAPSGGEQRQMVEVAAVAMDARAHGIGRMGAPEHGADALRLPQWDAGPRLSQLRGVGAGARADVGGQAPPPAPGKALPGAAQPGGARPARQPDADGACAAPAAAASDCAPAGEPAGVPVFVMLPLDTVCPCWPVPDFWPEGVHSSSTTACGHCARVYRSVPAPGRAPGAATSHRGLWCGDVPCFNAGLAAARRVNGRSRRHPCPLLPPTTSAPWQRPVSPGCSTQSPRTRAGERRRRIPPGAVAGDRAVTCPNPIQPPARR
jgi:hypothetical protein